MKILKLEQRYVIFLLLGVKIIKIKICDCILMKKMYSLHIRNATLFKFRKN